ncbi:MAG TPA: LacI family DNA-binding transcriptional regulator [Fimbriimonas sp.]
MRVTQQDIAKIANVSQATVSRVLAGDEKVEPTIRTRVVEAIRKHNYQPDVRARSLRSKHTGLIGLVVSRPQGGLTEDPFFASLTAEIIDYLAGRPYHLCLDMAYDEHSQTAIYDEMLRTRRVDGLILVESEARDARLPRLQNDDFPFVLIGNPVMSPQIHSVDNDNVLAAEMATSHLFEQGYRRVGIVAARPGVTVSDDRIQGYCNVIEERNAESLIWHADFGADAARDCAIRALSCPNPPDALVVLDDYMAMGVVMAARSQGIRVPDQLGVVSFNDTNLCELIDGGLTSVSLNIKELVAQTCDRLLEVISGEANGAPRRIVVPCELKVRGSSVRAGVLC